jgi:hypothetical protein
MHKNYKFFEKILAASLSAFAFGSTFSTPGSAVNDSLLEVASEKKSKETLSEFKKPDSKKIGNFKEVLKSADTLSLDALMAGLAIKSRSSIFDFLVPKDVESLRNYYFSPDANNFPIRFQTLEKFGIYFLMKFHRKN